jgi:formylglycine-generating enzyme required for sulfatase activity
MLLAYFGAVGVLGHVMEVMPPVADVTPGDWIGGMLVAALMSFFGFRGVARRSKAPGTVSAIVLGVSVLTWVPAFEEFVESHKNKGNRIGDAKLGEPPEGEDAKREARITAEQAATAPKKILAQRPALGEAWVVADVGVKMVPIAPGSFSMGSTNGDEDERPVTQVTLTRPYWLGATEVTQGQWEAVMGNNPSRFEGTNLPVENVSYEDALAFCRKLTERERAANRLPEGYAYTLPTEAQWEYACRAGTTGDHAGNLNAMAWYYGNSGGKTHGVGGKQANAWGLHDMHGNVWEWCLDWRDYWGRNVTDPRGVSSDSHRVNRGGSWYDDPDYCRSANRNGYTPSYRYDFLGFRLALSSEIIR